MGQQAVKRVPSDFKWPLNKIWHGYENPWPGPVACYDCMTSGFNRATRKIYDTFRSWAPKLTKDEAKTLLEKGVSPKEILKMRQRASGWDTPLLRITLSEIRAARKGVFGACLTCDGEGFIPNPNPAVTTLYKSVDLFLEWEQSEPPYGTGWQLWDDPEGAPISPVFDSAKELAEWCERECEDIDVPSWEAWIVEAAEGAKPSGRPPFRIQSDHFKVYSQPKVNLLD